MKNEYSDYIQPAHWKYHAKRTIESVGNFFIPYIKEGAYGLDAGCGTGSITYSIAKYVGNTGKILGVDINSAALELARTKYKGGNIEFMQGNLYRLPFRDNVFDFVFSHGVLIHCQKPTEVLGELYRVLKPGGTMGISAVDHDSILLYPDEHGLLMKSIELQEELWRHGSGWGSSCDENSNLRLGKELTYLLCKVGFNDVVGSARSECYGTRQDISQNAESEIQTLSATPFRQCVTELNLASDDEIDLMIGEWRKFADTAGAFRAKLICEAVAKKRSRI